jgi:hypothetical protein
VEGSPATASTSDTASTEQPLLQHVDGKTDRVAFEEGSAPCESAALEDEGDGMGLLSEVVVEASSPDNDAVGEVHKQASDVSALMCFLLRWPLRLIWGAIKVARKMFRAVMRR